MRSARRAPRFYPEASGWAREELSLPMFAELRPKEIESVLAACAHLLLDTKEPTQQNEGELTLAGRDDARQ